MTRYKTSTQAYREKRVHQIEGSIKLFFWLVVICIVNIPINFFIDACMAGIGR